MATEGPLPPLTTRCGAPPGTSSSWPAHVDRRARTQWRVRTPSCARTYTCTSAWVRARVGVCVHARAWLLVRVHARGYVRVYVRACARQRVRCTHLPTRVRA
eukprot:2294947-Pleurochrysis_carterae.AAC.10